MNLLKFAHKTAPLPLYAIPALFTYGSVTLIGDSTAGALAVFFAGAALFLAYLLGVSMHRQRLISQALRGWMSNVGKWSDQGHPAPSQKVALEYHRYVEENPIEAWRSN